MYSGPDKKVIYMRHKNHYSKLRSNAQYPDIIGKYPNLRGYYQIEDILKEPFEGKVEVVDTKLNLRMGNFTYASIKNKYKGMF